MKMGNLEDYKSNLNDSKLKIIKRQMTKKEKKEQVVSNIYGLMDSDSQVTKEEIEEELKKFYG